MAKMFSPPKAPTVVTTTSAPAVTATPVTTPTTTPTTTTVTTPAPVVVAPVVAPPRPAPDPDPVPVVDSTPKVVDTTTTPTTTPVVKPETDPTVAAEQALARRDRSVSGTVLTSWRGVLQPTATGSAVPARKRLLGE